MPTSILVISRVTGVLSSALSITSFAESIYVFRYLYKVLRGKLALLEADIDTYSLQENISSVGFS